MTQPNGSMPARRRSACRRSASCTGRGLRERDDEHPRELGVTQAREQLGDLGGHVRVGALHLALVALRGVEQQQRVAGRGGVEHDDALARGVDRPGEGAEHGDLLGARGAQVLFQQRAALLVKAGGGREHLLGVAGGFDRGVDALDDQRIVGAASASASVMCAAGSVVESVTSWPRSTSASAMRGREGRFADPAFAHRHHHAVAGGVKLIDELVKAGKVNRDSAPSSPRARRRRHRRAGAGRRVR